MSAGEAGTTAAGLPACEMGRARANHAHCDRAIRASVLGGKMRAFFAARIRLVRCKFVPEVERPFAGGSKLVYWLHIQHETRRHVSDPGY